MYTATKKTEQSCFHTIWSERWVHASTWDFTKYLCSSAKRELSFHNIWVCVWALPFERFSYDINECRVGLWRSLDTLVTHSMVTKTRTRTLEHHVQNCDEKYSDNNACNNVQDRVTVSVCGVFRVGAIIISVGAIITSDRITISRGAWICTCWCCVVIFQCSIHVCDILMIFLPGQHIPTSPFVLSWHTLLLGSIQNSPGLLSAQFAHSPYLWFDHNTVFITGLIFKWFSCGVIEWYSCVT